MRESGASTLLTMRSQKILKSLLTATAVLGIAVISASQANLRAQKPAADSPSKKVDFVRDIQPIFQKSCYMCHGPINQMANLRLDARQSALAKVLVAGKPEESPLYIRVAGIGDVARMPMGGRLADAQVALIKAWIAQGADWPESSGPQITATKTHWAFVPPTRPALPEVKNASWVRNPIDDFVLARLEKEGLSPSPEADKVLLLRRLSLDLTGLPPTPDEVDAFAGDKSKNAYEKQVDRLLNSPHYGEMWGRRWLDAARYADSDGYEKDKTRQVWFYRDWVVNALNSNMPYNQFVIRQIAGDLLPNHTQEDVVATGFLRNSMINEEGGVDPEQFRVEAMFDRMHAVGTGILGLTIQCAQCHNHKFDPLKQEEYYRMMAFLNNTHEANVAVYTTQEEMVRDDILRRTREIEGTLKRHNPDWPQRMAKWEEQVAQNQPEWTVVQPEVDRISDGGQKYFPQKDGSFLAQGYAPTKHTVKMTVKTGVDKITAFRLELMNDANLPLGGPGRSLNGTCALTEFKVEAAPADAPDKLAKIKFVKATSDVNPPETPLAAIFDDKSKKHRVTGPVDFAIDDKEETAWGIDMGPGLRNQPRKAVFVASAPISNPDGKQGRTVLVFKLQQDHGGWNSDDNQTNNLGRFRLSITTSPDAVADPLPAGVRAILAIPPTQRTPQQVQTVFSYWRETTRETNQEWKEANGQIAALWKHYPEGSTQLVMAAREDERETHVLTRGDFLKPAKKVDPGVPSFLNQLPAQSSVSDPATARLAFAEWLVDRKAPTTARSLVNRFWQGYFGIGIVSTSEDLGTQTDPPSHPELLDWLAVELMDKGWNMKAMHRLIVTSATYRQSSNVTPALYERDPYNRLLARGPRFRVDGEVVRDITLTASGLLDLQMGGPSVHPPAPAFLFQPPVSYGPKNWDESTSPQRYRRAIYTFRFRSVPYPMLETFDTPNGDSTCVRRARSNTPLQALMTLNETLFLEAARALALKAIREGGTTDDQRIVYIFRRSVSRTPSEQEEAELRTLLAKEERRYSEPDRKPWELAANDPAHPPILPSDVTPAQAAAWTIVSRVVLNLDETITKE
jgi:mono/diheme cytochrome c family protein